MLNIRMVNLYLHFAVDKGHSVIIQPILKHCPDVNNKSNRNALNGS